MLNIIILLIFLNFLISFQYKNDLFDFQSAVNCFITFGSSKMICNHWVTMVISDWLAVTSYMCQYFSLKAQV